MNDDDNGKNKESVVVQARWVMDEASRLSTMKQSTETLPQSHFIFCSILLLSFVYKKYQIPVSRYPLTHIHGWDVLSLHRYRVYG